MQSATSQAEAVAVDPRDVICVDLEGALLRTNPSNERLMALLRQRPTLLLQLPGWWAGGRARAEIDARARLGCDFLPLYDQGIAWLRAAHAEGRELVLLSGLAPDEAERIAQRLGIFSRVQGGLGDGAKRVFAEEAFGRDVAYLGREDMIEKKLIDQSAGESFKAALKALRLHQWAKNLLVFVPVALTGPLAGTTDWLYAACAFLAFGLLASAGYVVNDLLDLEADRRHRTKWLRPFAAGDLSLRTGLLGIPLLGLGAAALCLVLPTAFALIAGLYFATTLAYSFWLKREPFLDVIVLAALFTIRILAGAVLLSKPFSYWLLTFAMFFFLSLATAKRVVEIKAVGGVAQLRGYGEIDLSLLIPLGVSSVVAANVIFVTYLIAEHFPGTTYTDPEWLWLLLPLLLYWSLRLWRVVMHGQMHDDPVMFALHDRVSQALGVLAVILLFIAW